MNKKNHIDWKVLSGIDAQARSHGEGDMGKDLNELKEWTMWRSEWNLSDRDQQVQNLNTEAMMEKLSENTEEL